MLPSDDANIQISCSLSLVMLKYIIYKVYIWQQQKYTVCAIIIVNKQKVEMFWYWRSLILFIYTYHNIRLVMINKGGNISDHYKSLIPHFCTSNKKPSTSTLIALKFQIVFSPLLLTLSCYIFEHLSVHSSSCKGSNPLKKTSKNVIKVRQKN